MPKRSRSEVRSPRPDSRPRIQAALGFPLLYKVLVANVVIVALGAALGTAGTAALLRADPGVPMVRFAALAALVGLGVSAVANAAVLKLALSPVRDLEETAKRLRGGDADARVPPSPFADAELRLLSQTFNDTLTDLASYRHRVRAAAAAAVGAAEAERKRIAQELHDDTASTLTALLVRLRMARTAKDDVARDRELDAVRDGMAEAIEAVHRIVRALRPPVLDEMGVATAIEAYARHVRESTNVRVSVRADAVDGLLDAEAELALYRIVQEAMSNAVRHAKARTLRVHVERRADEVRAVVRDDGRGFAVSRTGATAGDGLGLQGMRERAAYVGGRAWIDSRPGAGTVVHVQIPLKETT